MEIEYEYSAEKNSKLKLERGISFEEIIYYIGNGHLLVPSNIPIKINMQTNIFM